MLIRIGTRGSKLALTQSAQIQKKLQSLYPKNKFELVIIKTQGDEFQSVELFKKNHVGVFTNEIEKRLLRKEVDLAVHSLKDLPTETAKGLVLAAIPKRAPIEDVLISRNKHSLRTLPKNAIVGTGSPRRKRQLIKIRPDLRVVDLRGNLDTRISKVIHEKKMDAIVVAKAGLWRIGLYKNYARTLPTGLFLPAVGQGALGIQARRSDKAVVRMTKKINDLKTELSATTERAFLKALQGGCRVPAGAVVKISGNKINIRAAVFSVNSSLSYEAQISSSLKKRLLAAKTLASILLAMGADKLLAEARSS